MTQIKPESCDLLRSAKVFMNQHDIEAIRLSGWGEYERTEKYIGIRGLGFLSWEEHLRGEEDQYYLGEIVVRCNGEFMPTPFNIAERMQKVEGFITSVIKPVKLAITQIYSEGSTLSDKRFRRLGI